MEHRFTICDMEPQHYAGKGHVHYASWQETYRGLMDDRILDGQSLEFCQKCAERYPQNTLVALDKSGKVVGFTCYCPEAVGPVSLSGVSELMALYVLRDFQGLGLGRQLIEASLTRLPHADVALFVLKGNLHAIEFYQHMGFTFTGHRHTERARGAEMTELEMVLHRK